MKIRKHIPAKLTFLILGIASTAWFLIRVIPKPSRATYPCMRAAAPFMSSFVVYLLSLAGSAVLIRRGWSFLYRRRFLVASSVFLAALLFSLISSGVFTGSSYAGIRGSVPADFPANIPYGEGAGIHPGRVVWAWDPGATDEHCTNQPDDPVRGEDGYFLAKNNDRQVISRMLDEMVTRLTGAPTVAMAWDSLFTDLNRKKGLGAVTYSGGETIFIKINQGGGGWLSKEGPDDDLSFSSASWAREFYGMAETSPMVVVELLDQLVNGYGIPQEQIYVGDPIAHIFKHSYEIMHDAFPGVKYVDYDANHADLGRTILTPSSQPCIYYSDKGSRMPGAVSDRLYAGMENAGYLVNVAALKAHALAGITLTAKNHFGSHTRDGAPHLHPGLIGTEDDNPVRTEYGMYRVLTDIMGHRCLGGNTVLFVVDGLWGGTEAKEKPVKWDMSPFSGDWPSSIFGSQDQVALESVCFDFLRSEFDDPDGDGRARPWMGGADDHLHQAADQQFWPEGLVYDPENDGIPIGSLGVHEHWNNAEEKSYSANMGTGAGIELLALHETREKEVVHAAEARIPPVIDGDPVDRCWTSGEWEPIGYPWDPWGNGTDSTDFHGRYQVSWSGKENLLYFLVEITDDRFVDGYLFPGEDYQDFDILEIYLDEDGTGGYHAFEDDFQLEGNAENAFTYHLAARSPAAGETVTAFFACDIHGYQSGDHVIDYAGHLEGFALRREGSLTTWEFSLRVYGDTYTNEEPESSREALFMGKEMGFSVAVCDNDSPGTPREHYYGSVGVPRDAGNSHWIDADYFGVVWLEETRDVSNLPVEAVGSVEVFEITEKETNLVIHGALDTLFSDPDQDPLKYTVRCDQELLVFTITDNRLEVWAGVAYAGETVVELVASDGEFEATIPFMITAEGSVVEEKTELGPGISCFPDPFTDYFYLEIDNGGGVEQEAWYGMYNINGQLVRSGTIQLPAGSESVTLVECPGGFPGPHIMEVRLAGVTHSRLVRKL